MTIGNDSHGVHLTRWVGLAMVLPALVAVALLAKDALLVVERINESALKRETAALERGIKLLGELNATELLQQTMWDTAFRNVVLSQRQDWMKKNFGKDALTADGVQQLFIVAPSRKVIFASQHEAAPPPEEAKELLTVAKGPIDRARALYRTARDAGNFDQRLPGAMTDGIYVNDLINIGGKPAMITVSPFTPDVEDLEAPAEPTLLVGVQAMTETLLDKLESLSHIDGLDHVTATHQPDEDDPVQEIRDSQGRVVTRLTWDFSSPGEAILRAALPAIGVSLALIALLTTLAAMTMRRLTRRLAESEQAAIYAARHDAATGIANRGWFMRVFADLLLQNAKAGPAAGTSRAVMLIDCDYFKSVNDTLGHAAGDAVLAAVASRLQGLGDRIAIAARLGGDEFALVTSPFADATQAVGAMSEIQAALTRPVTFEAHVIAVSVSIGAVTFATPSGENLDMWLAKADAALYRAKREGRGCGRLYDASIDGGEGDSDARFRTPDNDRNPAAGRAA
jgi:diguanylate cyclase (GGDEF)-like protein